MSKHQLHDNAYDLLRLKELNLFGCPFAQRHFFHYDAVSVDIPSYSFSTICRIIAKAPHVKDHDTREIKRFTWRRTSKPTILFQARPSVLGTAAVPFPWFPPSPLLLSLLGSCSPCSVSTYIRLSWTFRELTDSK